MYMMEHISYHIISYGMRSESRLDYDMTWRVICIRSLTGVGGKERKWLGMGWNGS
jgi:hypothetical protein